MKLRTILAENLRSAMAFRKMNQTAVAGRAEVAQSTVSRALRGSVATDLDSVEQMAAALGLALRKAITSPEQEARNMGMGQLCYAHYQAGQDTAPIYAKAIAERGIICTPAMIQIEHDAANRAADRRPLTVTCTDTRIGNTVSTTCK